MERSLDQAIDDDVLRLIFTACHPMLAVESRIALTLRLIDGLSTTEIARAFLVPEKIDRGRHIKKIGIQYAIRRLHPLIRTSIQTSLRHASLGT